MKIEIDLNVTAQEYFKVLEDSIIQEILYHTNKEVTPYSGYSYNKIMTTYAGHKRDTTVTITDFVQNKLYRCEFGSINKTVLEINIVEREDGITVSYIESLLSDSGKYNTNFKLVGGLLSPIHKRKAKKKQKAIEAYIIANRI